MNPIERLKMVGYCVAILFYFYTWAICFVIFLPLVVIIWVIFGRKPIEDSLNPMWKLIIKASDL